MKVAWLFPGQGSQAVGMGKELAATVPAARAVFDAADAALGESLSRLCFEGPIAELTLTANTQPAILTTSAAILAAMRERWPSMPTPDCAAGHSLGEYSALCAARVIPFADAVRVCRVRGRAMQDAVPAGQGAMAAVMGLEDDAIESACRDACDAGAVVCPANFNAPGQTVIAGEARAVERALVLCKERGGKVIPLNVSAPFHSPLMTSARAPLAEALSRATLSAPAFDVLANVDAAPKPDAALVFEALVEQVASPVQWTRTISRMRERGVTHALEIGHGKVLAGLVKRIDKELCVLSVSDPASIERIGEHLGF